MIQMLHWTMVPVIFRVSSTLKSAVMELFGTKNQPNVKYRVWAI
jgi:hypothetical protein